MSQHPGGLRLILLTGKLVELVKIGVESCDLSDGLKKQETPRQAISFAEGTRGVCSNTIW